MLTYLTVFRQGPREIDISFSISVIILLYNTAVFSVLSDIDYQITVYQQYIAEVQY